MTQTLTPLIRWSDSPSSLRLKLEIHSCTSIDIRITSHTFSCTATSANNTDAIYTWNNLNLYADVHALTCDIRHTHIQVRPTCVYVTINKIKHEKWPRLTKETAKNNRILVDWDAVENELASEEAIDRALEEVAKRDDAMGRDEKLNPEEMEKWAKEMQQHRMNDKKGRSKGKHSNSLVHVIIHLYLILYNSIMWLGWTYVFVALLYIATTSYIDTTYTSLSDIVNALQTLALAEIIHAAAKIVPGSWIGSFLLHGGRNIILMGLLQPLHDLHHSPSVFALYLVFSIGEIIRYPYYLLTTIDALIRMNDLFYSMLNAFFPPIHYLQRLIQYSLYARYTAPMILLPLGFITELSIIIQAYPLLEKMRLPMMSFDADVVIAVYAVLAYTLGAPYLFMTMYKARQKKLGPVKRTPNVADKVD